MNNAVKYAASVMANRFAPKPPTRSQTMQQNATDGMQDTAPLRNAKITKTRANSRMRPLLGPGYLKQLSQTRIPSMPKSTVNPTGGLSSLGGGSNSPDNKAPSILGNKKAFTQKPLGKSLSIAANQNELRRQHKNMRTAAVNTTANKYKQLRSSTPKPPVKTAPTQGQQMSQYFDSYFNEPTPSSSKQISPRLKRGL